MTETSGRRLRPARADDLGLRRALSDRLLPVLVGAVSFLAALALAGLVAADALGRHWRGGAGAALTIQLPGADAAAVRHALSALTALPGIAAARALSQEELRDLLRPWLGDEAGEAIALPLPAVIEARVAEPPPDLEALGQRLRAIVPGAAIESNALWLRRLSALAGSLQACAVLAMALVTAVAVMVVTVATRAGLAARRDAIEVVHGLGATDGFIAGQFARRTLRLAGGGGLAGMVLALPVLAGLGWLAAPLTGGTELSAQPPSLLWAGLLVLPLGAAAIGWLTAQATVRRWLRRLP